MRLPALALLAALSSATCVNAEGLVFETATAAPGGSVEVSWQLPEGYEESELLIELDGGPRVRLTDEQDGEKAQVVVRLPALVGTARFVVRAGRKDGDGRHREMDVARSDWFPLSLASTGTSASASVPVRAPSSHPASGEAMEWWSEATGRVAEGPSPGVSRPARNVLQTGTTAEEGLPSTRTDAAVGSAARVVEVPDAGPADPDEPGREPRERPFSGAQVPLRN